MARADVFKILMVCTGNICRSPLAEQLLALRLQDISEVVVTSAGTYAMAGSPMSPPSQEIARSLGVADPGSHCPRQISESTLGSADLIFAMAREHRRSIVDVNPRVARRLFTLREFARLTEATTEEDLAFEIGASATSPVEQLHAAVRAAALARPSVPPVEPGQDDVIDPYRRDYDMYVLSTSQIVPAVDAIAAYLRRAHDGTSLPSSRGGGV